MAESSGNETVPPAAHAASTKPYFLRALYEWCTDNGFTPYLTVAVDASTRVPNEYVKDGQIVLNVSFDATSGLKIGNDFVSFAARFGGVAREIVVPVERVAAIYARENGHGMGFEVTEVGGQLHPEATLEAPAPASAPERPPRGGRPKFTVVK
jgi:stringent starvation protein B